MCPRRAISKGSTANPHDEAEMLEQMVEDRMAPPALASVLMSRDDLSDQSSIFESGQHKAYEAFGEAHDDSNVTMTDAPRYQPQCSTIIKDLRCQLHSSASR